MNVKSILPPLPLTRQWVDDNYPMDEHDLDSFDISFVMKEGHCSRSKAIKTLRSHTYPILAIDYLNSIKDINS